MNVFTWTNSESHGGKYSGANTIIVANDEIAANPVLQAPLKALLAANMSYFSEQLSI